MMETATASPLTGHALVDGHRIAVGVHGEGRPLVLVHGTPAHSLIWRNLVPALVAAGRRVHLFDLLGYGASERPLTADTSVAAQEALLAALLDHWGLVSPDLVGHDIGGATALRLAVHRPDRVGALVLLDPVSYDSWPSPSWADIIRRYVHGDESLSADAFHGLMTRQLRMAVHDPAAMTGAALDAYLAPISGPLGQPAFLRHQVAHYDSRYTLEIAPALPGLTVPTHVVWGEEDRWQPLDYGRRLAADIGCGLTVIPHAGHFLQEDAPDAVAEAVLAFVNDREGGV